MMVGTLLAISVSVIMLLIRMALGQTIFDKILAANVIGTNIILAILFLAYLVGDKQYIDIALVYALLNFIGTIGFLRFYKKN